MAKTDVDDTPDLAAELAALRKDVERLAATLGRLGEDRLAGAAEAARARLDEGAETLKGVEARVLEETTRHPWRALGLAALGGLVLGLILRR